MLLDNFPQIYIYRYIFKIKMIYRFPFGYELEVMYPTTILVSMINTAVIAVIAVLNTLKYLKYCFYCFKTEMLVPQIMFSNQFKQQQKLY